MLAIVALLLFLDDWLDGGFRLGNPLRLFRAFTIFCLVPETAAWLLGRPFAVTAAIESDALVLQRYGQRTEIPLDAIERVSPWTVPLPSGGLWLRLRSGRRWGLHVADPIAFIEALAAAGAPEPVRVAARRPAAIHARSMPGPSVRWYHRFLKFVVVGLVPALPLFRLHQWIAYGGTFGEYYAYGLKAYLLALGIYWGQSTVYLVLYAATLRAVTEPIVLMTAYGAPARTRRVRRAVETGTRIAYYGGVALFLLRFWSLS